MAEPTFQTLPGFRDFTPPECAVRNYLFETWRMIARLYGFTEYDTPVLEDTGLYLKKSGGELGTQLFRFNDQGGRDVTLRPEVTASLARLAATHQRQFPKPLKWFQIGQCFRYEKPQKGRGREFYQFNADILGDGGPAADAELIALAIDTMRALGFGEEQFYVRVSDREAWMKFCQQHHIAEDRVPEFLQIIDKLDREKPESLAEKLKPLGVALEDVHGFIDEPANCSENYLAIERDLGQRGLGGFLSLDLGIVRGLAYYTGTVFEIFDTGKSMRAVAGGGRYDTLVKTIGGVDLPATGFAMGDYVIRNLIEETPSARLQMDVWLQRQTATDVYLIIADEVMRPEALRVISVLRDNGISCDLSLTPTKIGKQFQRAEQSGARFALVIGTEYPVLTLKILASRTEERGHAEHLVLWLTDRLREPDGPLLA